MGWSSWDDWVKRNASWTGLKNIAGEGGSWINRNVEQPWAALVTNPIRGVVDPNTRAMYDKGGWKAGLPFTQASRDIYQSWNAPSYHMDWMPEWSPVKQIGLKGATELSMPLNWLPLAAGPGLAGKGLGAGAKLARGAGAMRTATALERGANVAGKVGRVTSALEQHPFEAAMHGPRATMQNMATRSAAQMARQGEQGFAKYAAQKAAQGVPNPYAPAKTAAESLTNAGRSVMPNNINYSLANKGTQNFKWVEMTPGKTFPKGTEYKVAQAGGKQRTFAKVEIPEKVVQNPLAETVTTGATSNVPPGASGGVVPPTGGHWDTPGFSEQALRWAKTQMERSKEKAMGVKAEIREMTADLGAAIRQGRKVGGEDGWRSVKRAAGEVDKGIPTNPTSKGNVDYLRRRIDDWANKLDVAEPKKLHDFEYQHANEALDDFIDNIRPDKAKRDALIRAIPELGDMPKFTNPTLKGALATTVPKLPGMLAREISSDMRIAQTILDASNLLRQNIQNTVSHPFKTAKGFGKAELSMFGRQDITDAAIRRFETGPSAHRFAYAKANGLNKPYVSFGGAGTKAAGDVVRDEFYEGGWLMHNIPGIKQVTEASERSFSTMGNIGRADKYEYLTDSWAKMFPDIDEAMKKGELDPAVFRKNPTATARTDKALKMLDQIGEWTNITTGRGNLPKMLQEHAATLNVLLYASRLLSARVGYIPKGIVFSIKNPVIRKEFARELVGLTAFTIGTLYTAKMLGATVEMDPRSTDFGKIRVGDTRIDLMGGFQPYIRYTAQFMTGERKTATGEIAPVNRGDTFARFLRSKESPVAGLVHDMWSGETFIGESSDLSKETLARTAYSKFTPLFVQDVIDVVKQEGVSGAALAAPGFFGGNVLSYPKAEKPTKQTVVKPLSQEQIIENQAWAQNPYWKTINDQIKLAEETVPGSEARLLKKYPKLVQIRKEIAKRKRMVKGRSWQNKT